MKKIITLSLIALSVLLNYCSNAPEKTTESTATENTPTGGQEAVKDDESGKDVVKVAIGSPDHTTLVAALKQAELVTALSNAGPFTVFAPTNEAFNKLPAGTVDKLLKPEMKKDLTGVLTYHVVPGALKAADLKDGMKLKTVQGPAPLNVSAKPAALTAATKVV